MKLKLFKCLKYDVCGTMILTTTPYMPLLYRQLRTFVQSQSVCTPLCLLRALCACRMSCLDVEQTGIAAFPSPSSTLLLTSFQIPMSKSVVEHLKRARNYSVSDSVVEILWRVSRHDYQFPDFIIDLNKSSHTSVIGLNASLLPSYSAVVVSRLRV